MTDTERCYYGTVMLKNLTIPKITIIQIVLIIVKR